MLSAFTKPSRNMAIFWSKLLDELNEEDDSQPRAHQRWLENPPLIRTVFPWELHFHCHGEQEGSVYMPYRPCPAKKVWFAAWQNFHIANDQEQLKLSSTQSWPMLTKNDSQFYLPNVIHKWCYQCYLLPQMQPPTARSSEPSNRLKRSDQRRARALYPLAKLTVRTRATKK